jgi:two-component system copper resistance phosphate regulon response regulator CusR
MTVDMVRRTVIRSGKKIHLTGKEYVLLELLLQRLESVTQESYLVPGLERFDSDTNVIDVAVRRLRSKIDDFEPKLIHTVRGAGYVWRSEKSEVQNFPDHTPEPDFFCGDAYGMVVIKFYPD